MSKDLNKYKINKIKSQKNRQEIRILSRLEIIDVLKYLEKKKDERKLFVFSLAVFSGLRENEITTMQWKDIMTGNRVRRWFVPTVPKKGNLMPALMNEITVESIKNMRRENKKKGKIESECLGVCRGTAWRWWDKLQKDVWGYHGYRFHDLRHTAITEYYSKTRDIWKTKTFARHKNLQSTEKYIHLAERPEMEIVMNGIVEDIRENMGKIVGVIGV